MSKRKRNKRIDELCSLGSTITILIFLWLLFMFHFDWRAVLALMIPFLLALVAAVFFITKTIKALRVAKALATDDYDDMSGDEFEYFCADILRGNGYKDVEVTKASGDHGIDVLARKDGLTYAIQCKRYSKPVGNKAVQEAYSGKAIYHADIAVVMSNMEFTAQAVEDARRLNVELWDRNKIYALQRKSGQIVKPTEFIEEKKEDYICPNCGGNLVIRTAKRGTYAGSKFYGCSNFPDCKYTRNI